MPEEKCLFCAIAANAVPAKKVYEDESAVAFLDINPRNPGHTIVIPKRHYGTLFEMPADDAGLFFQTVKNIASMVLKGTHAQGMNILQNNGLAAGQMVQHLHFHLIPRFQNEGPVSLEGMLQVKRMDEKTLDKISAAIKAGAGSPEPGEIEEPEPVVKKSFAPQKPKGGEQEAEEEFEEIDFE